MNSQLTPAAAVAALLIPSAGWAQHGDLTHGQAGVENAAVDFGVLPTAPLGPHRASSPARLADRLTRAPIKFTTLLRKK